MVKSFTGVRKAPEKKIQDVTAADCMTRQLTTFKPSQPIGEVALILMKKNLSGGPVVDEAGRLIGIISEGDCLKEVVGGKYSNSPNEGSVVSDHMAREVITIHPEMNILEVAQKFLNTRVRRFPVLKNGELVGQISQRDVLRAVSSLQNTTW